jgi:hypothetical protein
VADDGERVIMFDADGNPTDDPKKAASGEAVRVVDGVEVRTYFTCTPQGD